MASFLQHPPEAAGTLENGFLFPLILANSHSPTLWIAQLRPHDKNGPEQLLNRI
jgi:hypothetical protein